MMRFSNSSVPRGALVAIMLLLQHRVVQGQMTKLEAPPCTNWEETKANLDTAKAVWTQPACYDFSYTFLGFQIGLPAPKNVQVRNGVVAGGAGDKTVNDFFNMIESLCVQDCPTAGAQRCRVSYDDTVGYPTSILIDISQYIADEERMYSLSDFAVIDCDTAPLAMQIVEEDEISGTQNPAVLSPPTAQPVSETLPALKENPENNNEVLSEVAR